MNIVFYASAGIAVVATLGAITRMNPVNALVYFIVSLLAVGMMFFVLGAPFVAALIVIINAGAIMVMFVFVVMMVNQGRQTTEQELGWMHPRVWIIPLVLMLLLLGEVFYVLIRTERDLRGSQVVEPWEVGQAMFGPYMTGVEIASTILLVGLLGAYHLARSRPGAGGEEEPESWPI